MATLSRPGRPTANFSMVSNAWIRDDSLSLDEMGLLVWLASHEQGFSVDEAAVMARAQRGRDFVRRLLRRLVEAGYLARDRVRDAAGKLRGVVWRLTSPNAVNAQVKPMTDRPVVGADQAKHDVCPGQTNDYPSSRRSPYTGEDKEKTQDQRAHARATGRPRTMPGKIEKSKGQRPLPGVTEAAMAARTDMLVREQVDTITGEWLDRCAKTPPSSIRAQVRAQIHALVLDGIDPDDIRRGCARWMTTGLPPSQLAANVNAAMNQTAPARRAGLVEVGGQLMNERTRERLALVEHFEAQQQKAIGR